MTTLEKANTAAMGEVRRQFGLKPIPGDVGGGWAGTGDPMSLDLAPVVRAVLTAIREPDEAMLKALDVSSMRYRGDGREIWRTGIDAILAEKE